VEKQERKTNAEHKFEVQKRNKMGSLTPDEITEIAKHIRIIEHSLDRLILLIPPRLGIVKKASVDLLSTYSLFIGVKSQLSQLSKKPKLFNKIFSRKDYDAEKNRRAKK